jgi:hypothetical protein
VVFMVLPVCEAAGGDVISHVPLYISFDILQTKQPGVGHENDFTARSWLGL